MDQIPELKNDSNLQKPKYNNKRYSTPAHASNAQ